MSDQPSSSARSVSSNPGAAPLELGGSVWLRAGQQTLGGAARIALLAAIRDTGSITSAAKAVGISYKAAWDAVDTMNNLAGEPLVMRAVGGKGGGATSLNRRGHAGVGEWQPLIWSAKDNNLLVATQLLDNGTDVNTQVGRTPRGRAEGRGCMPL